MKAQNSRFSAKGAEPAGGQGSASRGKIQNLLVGL